MRIRLLFAATLLSASCLAHADEASHQKAVEDLLDVMHAEVLIKDIRERTLAQFSAMVEQQTQDGINEAQREISQRYTKKLTDLMGEFLSWPKMRALQISVYKKVFTEAEVGELITFYSTPSGQKFLARAPEIMSVTMNEMQSDMKAMLPRVRRIAEEMAAEMKRQKTPAKKHSIG